MIVVGIDPSIVATGLVVLMDGHIADRAVIGGKGTDIVIRVRTVRQQVEALVSKWEPEIVAIEGFSFGSQGRSVMDTGYLGYRIRESFQDNGVKYLDVAPAALKKYAAGQGNVNKPDVRMAVYKRWGIDITNDNLCDAYVLARIAEAHLQYSFNPVQFGKITQAQYEVLEVLAGRKQAAKPRKKKGGAA